MRRRQTWPRLWLTVTDAPTVGMWRVTALGGMNERRFARVQRLGFIA